MDEPFDFELHRTQALSDYAAVRERYVRYCATIESILRMALRQVHTHHIGARAKELESFAAKAAKPNKDDPTKPQYPIPLKQIEDMAAARIITYVLRALPQVERAICDEFDVCDRIDKSDKLLQNAQVGYRSIHLIVEMKPQRVALLEYQEFAGLRAEVQIRTILQHAWAEIEHDMRYKPSAEPNKVLSQRFTALAGLIEVGDREFEHIYEIDERRRKELIELAQISEVTPATPSEADASASLKAPEDGPTEIAQPPDLVSSWLEATQPRELISSGNYSEAIARYNALIQREPRQFAHYLGRAKARFLSGEAQGALKDIEAAEGLSPGNRLIARVRALIEGQEDVEQRKTIPDYAQSLRRGRTALREGNPDLALAEYSDAEARGFNPVLAVFNRAMALFLARNYAECQNTLNHIDPFPRSHLRLNVIALRTLCYLLAGGGSPKVAMSRLGSTLADATSFLIYTYDRSALPDLESGIQKHFTADEQAIAAPVFELLRQMDAGAIDAQTFATPEQDRPLRRELLDLAQQAENIGDKQEATRLFEQFLSVSEGENQMIGVLIAASRLGVLAKESGAKDSAVLFFTKAAEAARSLGRDRDLGWNLGNLGSMLRDQGDLQGAEKSYEEALHIADANRDVKSAAITLDNLGVVKAKLGDLKSAAEFLRQAIKLDPGDRHSGPVAGHYLNLGLVLWREGQQADAKIQIEQAYSLCDGSALSSKWRFANASDLVKHLASDPTDLPFV